MPNLLLKILTRARYKSILRGTDIELDSKITEEGKHVQVPTLLITTELDYVARGEMQTQGTAKWAKKLQIESLPSGHWPQLELPDRMNQLLDDFVNSI